MKNVFLRIGPFMPVRGVNYFSSLMTVLSFLSVSVLATAVSAEDWLAVPSEPSSSVQIKSEGHSEAASSQQLISWMSTASQHGIDIPQSQWLQLATDPSEQNVRKVASEFASYLDTGRLDRKVYQPGWRIADRPALPVLQEHMDSNSLDLIEPRLPQYELFKKTLQRFNTQLEKAGDRFPADMVLEEGDRHPSILILNQWLIDLDLADRLPAGQYSRAHMSVVKKLQKQYRIRADGYFGQRTRQALVALTLDRIKVLKVNMERMRWMPRSLPYPHVLVDIAGFNVAWVTGEGRQKVYRAIVGKPSRQTPVFQESIESITVNPYWRVPSSISSTSLLRKAQKNPEFLKREGFTVYASWKSGARKLDPDSINWKKYSRRTLPYRLEQKPGKVNRLGKYKLDSPNAYSIYLHDTDKPELFKRSVRTFSSGCTRVENIDHLIGNILKHQGMGDEVRALKTTRETGKLKLRKAVPLYFVYFTAWPDSNGRIRFRKDVYKLDDALLAKL
ncbi:MAG: L,D-transpeptidase family protein [Endozoicomonas sp.]